MDTEMQLLFAIKQGLLQVNWTYLILQHMSTYSKNAIELPYAFFLSKIFLYFGVNFSNGYPVKMGDFVIYVKVCNNKMRVKYS